MKRLLENGSITQLSVGGIFALLIIQAVIPMIMGSDSGGIEAEAGVLSAVQQYQPITARIEQLNLQQCDSDKMVLEAHAKLVEGLSSLSQSLAVLNKSTESLQRSLDRIERKTGP